jgi:hypothetical protein
MKMKFSYLGDLFLELAPQTIISLKDIISFNNKSSSTYAIANIFGTILKFGSVFIDYADYENHQF